MSTQLNMCLDDCVGNKNKLCLEENYISKVVSTWLLSDMWECCVTLYCMHISKLQLLKNIVENYGICRHICCYSVKCINCLIYHLNAKWRVTDLLVFRITMLKSQVNNFYA